MTDRIITTIRAQEIVAGDRLLIGRHGRPAEISVASLNVTDSGYYEHAGAQYGGEKHVVITTTDGAVYEFSESEDWDSDKPAIDELGTVQRSNASELEAVVAVSWMLDDIFTPAAPERGYYQNSYGDEEFEDDATTRRSDALDSVLMHFRALAAAQLQEVPAATVAAAVLSAGEAEVARERAALGQAAGLLSQARAHPRFPKSTAYDVDRGIKILSDAAEHFPAWANDRHSHFSMWPEGSRTMLVTDWATARHIDVTAGPQVPLTDAAGVMESIRAIRATAVIVFELVMKPLGVASIPKNLANELQSVIAELSRISSGRTIQHLFKTLPEDPWSMSAHDLAAVSSSYTPCRETVYRISVDLIRARDPETVRATLRAALDDRLIDIDDIPILTCSNVLGQGQAELWPFERSWILDR